MAHRRDFFRVSLATTAAVGLSHVLSACGGDGMSEANAATAPNPLTAKLKRLTSDSVWTLTRETKLNFMAYHPQGLCRVGDAFYLSTVEITSLPTRLDPPTEFDRTTGAGRGHVLKFDLNGNQQGDLIVGEGTIYHPGGMDFDGTNLWVPAAEYRPNSQSILYKVDPTTLKATKLFTYRDHIGGLSRNTERNTLHAVSWGSRRFYRFALDTAQAASPDAAVAPADLRKLNHAFYIDYQDNQYLGGDEMLYTGLTSFAATPNSNAFALGGFEIVNLETGLPTHQVPIKLYAPSRRPMTTNATWFEATATGIRAYFVPDDDTASMYVYDVAV
ncbi:DUF6454 family protein [Pigmentiphaga litoralis]|uniref:DUF6454 family protein n=1 Tax=Pigmentiphaga litoralis TaxID=516702 RepID=UPI001672D248|nr:DUF6454 family protein [Pigmentiphaga litoralis]